MKAIEALENAVEAVTQAMEAIDNFAEEHGIAQGKPKTIMLDDLVHLVAENVDVCPRCAGKALYAALTFLRENDLVVQIDEDDDEDEEDEDDE